jgi:NADH-quinone oxidoreductase E subunit
MPDTVKIDKMLDKVNTGKVQVNIDKILEKYSSRDDLIPALQDIQKSFGYLSEDNLAALSKQIDTSLTIISGVATFYNQFKLKPIGTYHISICRGTACHVHDSAELLRFVEKKLRIKAGELTSDGKFSLEPVNCIGACAKAPAMMINDVVYGELTEKKISEIIDSLK